MKIGPDGVTCTVPFPAETTPYGPRIVAADPGDTHPRNLRRTARVPAPLASHARSSSESVVEASGATPH